MFRYYCKSLQIKASDKHCKCQMLIINIRCTFRLKSGPVNVFFSFLFLIPLRLMQWTNNSILHKESLKYSTYKKSQFTWSKDKILQVQRHVWIPRVGALIVGDAISYRRPATSVRVILMSSSEKIKYRFIDLCIYIYHYLYTFIEKKYSIMVQILLPDCYSRFASSRGNNLNRKIIYHL